MGAGCRQDELVRCQICLDVMRDPVRCPNEHAYGALCLSTYFATHGGPPTCPECRAEISVAGVAPARLLRNMIGRMGVVCNLCLGSTTVDGQAAHAKQCPALSEAEQAVTGLSRVEEISVRRRLSLPLPTLGQ